MKTSNIILVNNTGENLRMFDAVLIDCVRNDKPLPEELADLIRLDIVIVGGERRGVINAA